MLAQPIAFETEDLFGKEYKFVAFVNGGGNNQLYKIAALDNRYLAAKCYSGTPADSLERLSREFEALSFLNQHHIASVPQALFCHHEKRYALYEWLSGSRIVDPEIKDIDATVAFIAELQALSKLDQAKNLRIAKDAKLSGASVVEEITWRLDRLLQLEPKDENLQSFLNKSLMPAIADVIHWSKKIYQQQNLSFERELAFAQQTLSPSDFGFHNALRKDDHSISFLDFEYFGWDDPAIMLSAFLWHPAMNLSFDLKQSFVSGAVKVFAEDQSFNSRLQALFPLMGLIWCLIILNEFIPEIWKRRVASGYYSENEKLGIQLKQLKKSEDYLMNVKNSMEKFPYEM